MRTLKIEWKHLDIEDETCDRCYDTGENLNAEVNRLNRKLAPMDIKVEWFETKLSPAEIPQSNSLLFDGTPIEEILEMKVTENYCGSCSDLTGKETFCRTVHYQGETYEDIPAKAIREAVYKFVGIEEGAKPTEIEPICACCSECGDDCADEKPSLNVVDASGCSCGPGCCS